ncbi:MAG: O-antigen ligase family protein [Mycobacteriaceae bacterium]
MTGSIRTTPIPTSGELSAMALVGGAAVVGAVAMFGSNKPLLIVVAAVAGAGLVFAARRPVLALVIVVAIEVSNLSGVLDRYGSVPLFQGSMLLAGLAVALAVRDPQLRARLNAWTVICGSSLACFFATQVVATIGSVDVASSLSSLRHTAIDFAFLMLVLLLTQMTARAWMVATTIVAVFAVLSVLTVINEFVFGGAASFGGFSIVTTAVGEDITTLRYGGPLPDSNFWGRHLVMGLPLAAALLTRSLRSGQRLAASAFALSILALLAGVYLTQSRGTFLSAGIAIVLWFVASERSVRRWGLFSLPAASVLLLVPGVGDRLQRMFQEISHGQANGRVDPSLLGRLAAQQQAGLMFEERPYFGFGPATFPGQVVNFAGQVPMAVREPANGAHNIYLSLAAESGLLGLTGWTVMVCGFLAVLVLRIIAQPRCPERVLAAALVAAIIGYSVSSAGLHLAYFRTFAVVLAMVAAVAPAWPVPTEALRAFRRAVGVWLLAGAVGLGVYWMVMAVNSPQTFRATQRVTLVPAGPADSWYAYALDIRSRVELLPTFEILLRDESLPVTIDADPVRGLMTFTAKADTPLQARDGVQLAVASAASRLTQSIGYDQYLLQTIGSMRVEPVRDRSTTTIISGVGSGAVAVLVIGLTLSSAARRRGRNPDLADDLPIDASRSPVFERAR